MAHPTADWDIVGDRYYRKVQLYTSIFDQDLELENYVIVGAPYGGCLALIRNEEKLHSYRGTQAAKSSIDLYSCAGKLIRRINWDKGSIRGLGWSEDEKLLAVTEDGTVRCYYDLQGDFTQFSLGHASVHSWTLIPPAYTLSRSVEVLLAIDQTIYVVDATECEDRVLENGPFKHISVSPNGRFVALYTEDGKVWVISSDFQNKLSEYDSKARTVPQDVQWCGNNSVVLAWDDEVHMVGPNGAASKYYYDGKVHLVPDLDGVRIVTNDVCDFLQKVPDSVEEAFRLGSTSPASILLDAVDQLEKKSPKADDNIQLIRPNLVEAVDTCVRAAGHEFSIHWQKQLLKAASFGKSVLDLYNSDDFVDMCEVLRVLNAARYYEIGLPISYDQFIRLTPERLIQRLINRQEYLLALRISEYLRLPTDRIYIRWASQKVRVSSDNEDNICRLIIQKLEGKRGISFEEIARAAYDEGRGRLATELLNYEPRAGKQVPLLLSMEEDEIALDKAIESGDTDLVLFVLLHLKRKLPLASFFRVINNRPVATALVETSAQDQDHDLLKDLYYQDDRRLDGANMLFSEALTQTDTASKTDKLKLAQKLLQDSKEHTLELRSLDETSKLLKLQESFDKDLTETFTGLSVYDTIFKLTRLGYTSRAKKVQSDFKVQEKPFWWLRLRALVAKRDWAALEEMSKTKKSPIGWEPFFNEILSAGNSKLASSFIPKCTTVTPAERIDMWVKCGLVIKAGEEALKAKDATALEELKGKAPGAAAVGEIERMIRQLKGGR
ncbi:MAG: Kinesin [Chaenotheca gracillima]|nr:MAG: Kinesin [Chaenotheca gracillima]